MTTATLWLLGLPRGGERSTLGARYCAHPVATHLCKGCIMFYFVTSALNFLVDSIRGTGTLPSLPGAGGSSH